jgi:hypothetical protein
MPLSPRISPAKQATIDKFGECDRKLRLWLPTVNPYQAEHDKLEAEILSWSIDLAADQSDVVSGKSYQAEVSARGFQRTFTREAEAAVFDALKKIQGLSLAQFFSITLADVKAHLGKPFLEQHVPQRQTGPRKVTVVPRAEAVPMLRRVA